MSESHAERLLVARELLSSGVQPHDLELQPQAAAPDAMLATNLGIPFPAGLAPTPQVIDPAPAPGDALPKADVVVIAWTVAEVDALAGVMTPGFDRRQWYRYSRGFEDHYAAQVREGAPASRSRRLGSYFMTKVAGKSVLCVKSELHLNQDGVETGDGLATLPVKGLLHQIIAEAEPEIVITTGTSGAVTAEQALGSVVVTRGARFRLDGELRNEPFNGVQYNSDWEVPTSRMGDAIQIMRRFSDRIVEPPFAPPSKRFDDYQGGLVHGRTNEPKIWLDERDMPKNHPILSVDSFEFGTSANNLFDEGCACEMGDAVLGLVCDELGDDAPDWLVVRNLSIPQINADLPDKPRGLDMQTHWSVWYHETFGYWTSVNGALTCWAVIAGMES